ncbi:MAG: DNA primase [Candidatus Ryanbacteria bacterium RIFCSPLOWO2_01_FULL_48_26]|uniref:DNA primase n=1 Tax=Candidatus Ryanbacteria bacterium RIFCSPLOWO2_01_FULL_48_26 TaxID=1802126 RepID=A0A1G2GWY5_9BACT|nr:MAG: DNA primase [Candidatus Ryanbacteria bacterium RIFCSPLOWO2_01_FULL_48_26]
MAGSTTELIKEKLDVVDFIRGYLNLQPAGKNFKACCPFHKEKTPSFMVSPERQSWHCFGCGAHGDVFGFLMQHENLEFGEALRVLAEKTGVELRRLNPGEYKIAGLLYEINSVAMDFFKKSLQGFARGKKYLEERGLTQNTIEEFDIGWAPAEAEALSLHFLNSNYKPEDIIRAGLAVKTDRGMLLDRFRGRIMFPIHNHLGKVVGFTGRILPQYEGEGIGKYINSPESPIFNKSKLLYGFFKSKNVIKETGAAFLVEGQMDFLMSWQAGVRNAVASSGTALTSDHLHLLRRVCDELILSFDSDDAGSTAMERAIDLAESSDFNVKVVVLDDVKDPAEAVQKDPKILSEGIVHARPAMQFYFDKYLPKSGLLDYSRREELRALRVVLGKLKVIASPVARNSWLNELSRRTGVAEKVLTEEMERIEVRKEVSGTANEGGENSNQDFHIKKYSRRELIGERLLGMAVARNNFSILEDFKEYLADFHKRSFEILKKGGRRSDDMDLDEIINLIILGSKDLKDEEAEQLKRELMKEFIKERKNVLTAMVKRAEQEGDETGLASALEELNKLSVQVMQ